MINRILAAAICIFLISGFAIAQDSLLTVPPYLRFPTFPPVKLLETDSTTFFEKKNLKKNTRVLFILFSPDCEHCRKETEELVKNIDQFKKINIVMATMMPFQKMKDFYEQHELSVLKNVTVGQDIHFFLPAFYNVKNLPFHAFYDKKGNLISVFEGEMTIEKILAAFGK